MVVPVAFSTGKEGMTPALAGWPETVMATGSVVRGPLAAVTAMAAAERRALSGFEEEEEKLPTRRKAGGSAFCLRRTIEGLLDLVGMEAPVGLVGAGAHRRP